MNIAIISPAYLPIPPKRYGGTERVIFNLIKGLKAIGHNPILFGPADSQVDCEIVPTIAHSTGFSQNASEDIELNILRQNAIKKAYEEIEKNKVRIDILHSHGIDIKDFSDIPHLFTLHLEIVLSDVNKSRELKYFNDRNNLFYNTISQNANLAAQNLNVMGTVYNGLDPEEFPFVGNPSDYYSFVGRFNPDKNPHQAIELAILKEKTIKVAAKYEYVDDRYFQEKCKSLLSNPLVNNVTEQDDPGKKSVLSNAKLNLHPTNFREPFGLTVLEAAYCGTPTLAIRRGSMSELIENGKTGFLVEDFTEGYFLTEKCEALDRAYIASRARRMFNYTIMSKQYSNIYENIIKIYKDKINGDKLKQYVSDSKYQNDELYKNLISNQSNY
jgi:glycosyltransferase involved in cell wall biosynthesis